MAPDSLAPPIGLTSVTARVNGTLLLLEGRYQSGASTPILVWPRSEGGSAWLNPCRKATDLCCLREVNSKYRNDALASVQGPQCLGSLPPNLVGGSRAGVAALPGSFVASVPVGTAFVAILFVHANPFFILDGYQGFSAGGGSGSVETSLVIAHNPCYSVVVPGTLVSVCMQCNNPPPPNSKYVWTASWYVDYLCEWQCDPEFVRSSSGLACEAASRQIPLMGLVAGACASVIVAITAIYCALRRVQVMASAPEAPDADLVRLRTEMIQFKDGTPPILRVKKN